MLGGAICLLGVTSALAAKYSEAPMLRAKVAAGELPSVEERLPEDVLVVKPVDKIGQYGKTLRIVDTYWFDFWCLLSTPLFGLAQDFETGTHEYYKGVAEGKIVPALAKGGEFSEDKKTFTLYLREGLKWSDGAPLTADDLLFWWEDVIKNKELTPVIGSIYKPGGELWTVEKVDDYTVRFHFVAPYKFFKYMLTSWTIPIYPLVLPKHYLKRFHIKYNSEADELAKKEGFDNWWNLFSVKSSRPSLLDDPECPTCSPWKIVERKPDRFVAERNPYYWKVDTAGNQLPYIDRVVCDLSADREVLNMKIIAGQVDYAAVALAFDDIPLFKANEAKGNYRLMLWDTPMGAMPSIHFNLTYKKDPVLGDIFRDVRFRQAMSLAINREEVNQVVYFGLSYPTQATCLPESKFWEPEFAKAYAEYNPEKANQLLDEMGLKWDKDHEWRLRPDGKTLTVVNEDCDWGAVRGFSKVRPLLKEYWEKIGVKTVLKLIDSGLYGARAGANELQLHLFGIDCNDLMFQMNFLYFVPGQNLAPLWDLWVNSEGESGEEPPEELKRAREQALRIEVSEDEEEIVRLGKEIFRLQAENLWIIGACGTLKQPLVVGNNLGNFLEDGVWASDNFVTGYAWPDQWFLKE